MSKSALVQNNSVVVCSIYFNQFNFESVLLNIMITNDNKIGAFLEWNTPISTFIKLYLNTGTAPFEGLFSGQLKAPELGHKVNN